MNSQVVRATRFKREWAPKYTLTRAYSGALGRGLDQLETAKILRALGDEILKRSRAEVRQMAFSDAAKKRLSKALRVQETPKGIRLTVRDPLWGYLMGGRKRAQMTWLRKAPRPIPIVTETGKVIFRSATAKSMRDGKWVHPGRPPVNFVDQVKREARRVIQKRLARDITQKLQRMVRG